MKVLIVGRNISVNTYGDNINFVKPLIELGNVVEVCDLGKNKDANTKKISYLISEFNPDKILFIPVEEEVDLIYVKKISNKIKTIAYFYDDTWRINYSLKWASAVNYVVTSDINWRLNFYKQREKVIYAPFFVNCNEYKNFNIENKDIEISFVGQYHPYREWIINKLKKSGFDVNVYGYGWGPNSSIDFTQMIEIFNRSKINLNISNCVNFDVRYVFDFKNLRFISLLKSIKLIISSFYKPDMKIYEMVKARFFEINACGGFQLAFYAQGLEHEYEIGEDLVIYSNFNELVRKIKYYLKHKEERNKISQNGYEKTIKFHDSKFRLKYIFSQIQ